MRSAGSGLNDKAPSARLVGTELNDAASFAQEGVEVSRGISQRQLRKVSPAESNAPPTAPEQDEDEDACCSLEGLTPGVCALAALARPAARAEQSSDLDFARPERLERALFLELKAALAGTHAGFGAARLTELEGELAGFFAALPKNALGLLEPSTARYALHQHFLRRHAWYIRSLNPVGEAQRPASAAEALRGHVPAHLQALFERELGGRGLGLRDLAALVATLEHLIQGDTGERLKAAYAAHGLQSNSTAGTAEVAEVLKTFMAHYVSLEHRSGYAMTPEEAREEEASIEQDYGGWQQVVASVDAVLGHLSSGEAPEGRLRFPEALRAAREVMRRFELNSAEECRGIKRDLSAMPGGATGRVPLAELHRQALEGKMVFSESTAYLEALGALEETEPGVISMHLPNYIISPSNCLGTTSFFDSCCPNECEALLEELERGLRASEATPGEVIALLDARSTAGPLPYELLGELEAAASAHGGRLALHGLAFAQWLHQAFPLECPRPKVDDFAGAGADVPGAAREFQAVSTLRVRASASQLFAELQGNASAAQAPLPGAGSNPDSSEALEAAAAKVLTEAVAGPGRGLKILQALDATSLAQSSVESGPAATEEPTSYSSAPTTGKLRVKGMQ